MGEMFTKVGRAIYENSVIVSMICDAFSAVVGRDIDGDTQQGLENPNTVRERHHN